ncbi:hypothetical protein CASFOL_016945 [Castilleja foliolosa]|uniref:Uncharacterized protein n=1 Tax=Castilleja foliolosa TaxID=1961234 RepID=A0ABD3DA47_9LAMI
MRGFYLLFGCNLLLLVVSFIGEAKINSESDNGVYIVYMGSLGNNGVPRLDHPQLLTELKERKKQSVLRIYSKSFLGFAARLSEKEANSIAQRDGVVSVFRDKKAQLHTTRSWDFLMSQSTLTIKDSTIPHVSSCSTGADTIIGIIDSGKIIGARYYDDPEERGYITTARDYHGHGTHVASIAAGVPVCGASYYGLAKGTARGGSPCSRIAVYNVCGDDGCFWSGILAAFDDAIADGVDVLSTSFSGVYEDLLIDPAAMGGFHAAEKGIIVVGSAGNSGPLPGTVKNVAPWTLTVGATSIDRDFETNIILGGIGIRKKIIMGGGINFSGLSKSAIYHLLDGRSAGVDRHDIANASDCNPGSLDSRKVKDKIVLCENNYGDYGSIEKFNMLKSQGAIGMILIDAIEAQFASVYGTSPIVCVDEENGARIRSYINSSTSNALATILPTRSVIQSYNPAPVVPFFSSRGPPVYDIQNLIKPDVAAPGLAILAAWISNDKDVDIPGKGPSLFNIISGTSMSCPHVSGLAAMVKSWHPTWSPSAIRSAIMTTATRTNNRHAPIETDNGTRATPYDIGAGEISPFGALYPGLVYEIRTTDYVHFLCDMGYNASVIKSISSTVPSNFDCPSNSSPNLISDMNYPSIAVSGLKANGSKTVTRTVTNVGEVYSTYTATVEAPAGMHVQVVPKLLRFTKTVTKLSFEVTFKLTTTSKEPLFGSLIWSNWNHKVWSPFAVNN